jgi:peptide/nickel transport system substrate-binding protein
VVFAIERMPITLDPRFATDTASENVTELMFNGLTKTNHRLEVVPDLAESFESKDGQTYRFRLRAGVKFHDGSPLTVEDVIRTFNFLADPANASPYRAIFKLVDRTEALDDRTVQVRLKEPYAFFPIGARRAILPKDFDPKKPIGTGPFRFVGADEKKGVRLQAFDGYFGGAPKIRSLALKPVLDTNVRILGLLKGVVDLVQFTSDGFPPGSLDQLKENRSVVLSYGPSTNVQYLNFQLSHPILKKLNVRKAFAHAIDRASIVRFKLGGQGEVADTFVPPTHWAHEKKVERYPFDVNRARKLLNEAGFPDPDGDGPQKRFTIVYKTSTNPQSIEIAEVIKSNLEAVGIGVEMKSMDFGVLFDDIKKGNFDIYSLQWTSILSPDQYYELFHSKSVPPLGSNRNRYSNADLDRLLENGRKSVKVAEQKAIFSEAQKIVARELPSLPLWYPYQVAAVRFRVKEYELNPRGTYSSLASAYLKVE